MYDEELCLVEGTTLNFEVIWEAGEGGERKPVDITNCHIDFQIRSRSTNNLLLACSTQDDGIQVSDPTTGTIAVHVVPEKTTNQNIENWQDACWELRVRFPSGDIYSLIRGWAKFIAGVVQ